MSAVDRGMNWKEFTRNDHNRMRRDVEEDHYIEALALIDRSVYNR